MSDSARLGRLCDTESLIIISKFQIFICMEIPFQLNDKHASGKFRNSVPINHYRFAVNENTEAFHRKRPLHLRILLMISEHLKLDLRKRENKF